MMISQQIFTVLIVHIRHTICSSAVIKNLLQMNISEN